MLVLALVMMQTAPVAAAPGPWPATTIRFDPGSARISVEARAEIERYAVQVRERYDEPAVVTTCPGIADAEAKDLLQRRASAVRQALGRAGVRHILTDLPCMYELSSPKDSQVNLTSEPFDTWQPSEFVHFSKGATRLGEEARSQVARFGTAIARHYPVATFYVGICATLEDSSPRARTLAERRVSVVTYNLRRVGVRNEIRLDANCYDKVDNVASVSLFPNSK